MIEVSWHFTAATSDTVTIHILIYDPIGTGIKEYEIFDTTGRPINSDSFDGCPTEARVDIGPIDSLLLPLRVIATDCEDETYERVNVAPPHPIPVEPGSTRPDGPSAPCSSTERVANPACDSAGATVVSIRNRLGLLCGDMERARNKVFEYRQIAAALFIAALAFIGLGTGMVMSGVFFLVLIGVALLALGAYFIVLSALFLNRAREEEEALRRLRERFDELSIEFDEAISNALFFCHCPDDLARLDITYPCT